MKESVAEHNKAVEQEGRQIRAFEAFTIFVMFIIMLIVTPEIIPAVIILCLVLRPRMRK